MVTPDVSDNCVSQRARSGVRALDIAPVADVIKSRDVMTYSQSADGVEMNRARVALDETLDVINHRFSLRVLHLNLEQSQSWSAPVSAWHISYCTDVELFIVREFSADVSQR